MAYDNAAEELDEGEEPGQETDVDAEDDGPIEYDIEAPNMVPDLEKTQAGKRFLLTLGGYMLDDYKTSWDANEQYRLSTAKNWELIAGTLPQKNWPFKDCANIHIPTALENTMRLTFRAYAELFGDWTEVFGVVPIGPAQDEVADILTLHGNWQLRQQIRDFPRQMHRAMLAFFFIGDVTMHSYYDPVSRLNRHEMLTPEDFVVPYASVTTQPDYSDVPWTCKILRMYRNELEARRDEWSGVEALLSEEPPGFEEAPDEPIAKTAAASAEQDIDDAQRVKPYKLLSYEGWCDLPGQDKQRFVQAIVHPDSGKILMLKLHEQINWQDQIRFEHQSLEHRSYQAQQDVYEQNQKALEFTKQQALEAEQRGDGGPLANLQQITEADKQSENMQPPEPPGWLQEHPDGPAEPRREPIRLFVHAVCIEPLKGNLGLSYGRIQSDHNRAVNTMMSQFVDAATLSNVSCFIAAGGVSFEKDFEFGPGKMNIATGTTPENLKNSIVPFTCSPPSAALFQAVEFVIQESSSSMQSPDVLSGEPGKSGEPYKGLAARIEQASKQLSVLTQKFMQECLQPVIINNAYLNSVFLDDDEIVEVVMNARPDYAAPQEPPVPPVPGMPPAPPTPPPVPQAGPSIRQIRISRRLYARNYQVVFRADLRFTSTTERVAEADEMVQMALKIPQLGSNQAYMYAVISKSLKARGLHELIPLLGAPPAPPPQFGPPPPPPGPPPGQGPPPGGPPVPGGPRGPMPMGPRMMMTQ